MDIKAAHQFCSNNQASVAKSKNCGCFFCLKVYPASEVKDFLPEEKTALCPKCNIDSVLCDINTPLDKKFLDEMNKYWF